jgi:hypothetical protein
VEKGKLVSQVSWGILRNAMLILIETDVPSKVATYIGGSINAQTVRDWRRGVTGIPPWVKELTRQRLLEYEQRVKATLHEVEAMPTAPGRGWKVPPCLQKKNPAG